MNAPAKLQIDLAESFPHLTRAPIVEAVIQIKMRPEFGEDMSTAMEVLKGKLPDYPAIDAQQQTQLQFKWAGLKPTEQRSFDLGWTGLRFRSHDQKYVALFGRDHFLFSRLDPYESWDRFRSEALRLWLLFAELVQPVTIPQLGLRYINRIVPFSETEAVNVGTYFKFSPKPPTGLDLHLAGFFHHEALVVPGHPYSANIIRTVQPLLVTGSNQFGLILDIAIVTTDSFDPQHGALDDHLAKMRWLKNKIFFGSITDNALQSFK